MRSTCFSLAMLVGLISGSLQAQEPSALAGEVVSQDGQPVAAAEISRFWVLGTADQQGARAYGSVRTDADGRFRLPLEQKDLPASLVVYTADRTAADVLQVTQLTMTVRVVLQPVSQVRLAADAPRLGEKLSSPRFLLQSRQGATLGQLFGNEVSFPFPPGNYQFSLSSADTVTLTRQIHIAAKMPVSLRLHLELSSMAKRYGKRPPMLAGLVDLQNEPLEIQLIDRPTLLYFWADWCQPCVAEGIPHLLQFAEAHRGERFQIVAIHENGVPAPSTTAAFRHSLQRLQENVWKRPLSFPFAFDASGKVTSAWGLSTFPTYALIDAKGHLERDSGLEEMEELVKKERSGR